MTAALTYTHTAQKPHTGYTRRGRNFGHTDVHAGVVHAANVGDRRTRYGTLHGFIALCGEFVAAECENLYGDVVTDHVQAVAAGPVVTCRRCRKVIDAVKRINDRIADLIRDGVIEVPDELR